MNYKKNENSKVRSSKRPLKSSSSKNTEKEEISTYQPELLTKNVALESGAVASLVSDL
jgi:hypothetical protein